MALNTDYAMRTGAFDPKEADVFYKNVVDSAEVLKTNAKQRYDELKVLKQYQKQYCILFCSYFPHRDPIQNVWPLVPMISHCFCGDLAKIKSLWQG